MMKVLVVNIGSTSLKFRLFEMDGRNEREIAAGTGELIGDVMEQLVRSRVLASREDLDAVAFKAVMGGDCDAVELVDDKLLERMENFSTVAPVHNPPYIAAMNLFRDEVPDVPLIAAFEPGFHATIPDRRRYYAVPVEWAEKYGIKRYGFHGASHRYIAERTAELMGADSARRIISLHLGGSSSVCAIRDGASAANSFGLSPQSGLPQTTRAGEFDPFALALLEREAGMSAADVLRALGDESGLAAISGTSGDMRDIHEAAAAGDERAQLAFEMFITAVRDYLGAYLVELGGTDAVVFTGGIGENDPLVRAGVCRDLQFAGIELDSDHNEEAAGETRIDSGTSQTALWVIPTNEELIVARQAAEFLEGRS